MYEVMSACEPLDETTNLYSLLCTYRNTVTGGCICGFGQRTNCTFYNWALHGLGAGRGRSE